MSTRVVDRIDDWTERSVAGGYRGLQELAEQEFSGVVRAGDTELYMANGVAVGLRRGSIEDFEAAAVTARETPSPALPLLAVLQERDLDVRDRFYSEQTPISDVDETLADGGFTGYIELSENVLSGDYYVVYHQGRSMSVGFVGESRRLVDGDEAFETANDEVGIYEVRAADIEHIDLPAPTSESSAAGGETDDETTERAKADDGTTETGEADDETTETAEAAGADDTEFGASPDEREPATSSDKREPAAPQESSSAEQETETDPLEPVSEDDRGEPTPDSPEAATGGESHGGKQADQSRVAAADDTSEAASGARAVEGTDTLEVQAIPSLDPARTNPVEGTGGVASHDREPAAQPSGPGATDEDRADDSQTASDSGATADTRDTAPSGDRVAELEAMLGDRAEEIERLQEELTAATDRRDGLREELSEVENERDDLRAEVKRLETELAETASAAPDAGQEMSPTEALTGTDIFIRYYSKGNPTLEDARGGSASRDDVGENLQLEVHTQFERDDVAVGGQTYDTFLTERLEHQFVEWVTHDLLFEIRETSNQTALADLYDVIPQLDHAELNGRVGVDDEDTEQFDIVFRNRTGSPLVVANLNDSREAATESMMETVITKAEGVGRSADAFSGAFLVTRSFFDASAIELAGETTQSGLLSRDKRKSFVKLSRKRGYHLCLVEARDENFHLAAPDL